MKMHYSYCQSRAVYVQPVLEYTCPVWHWSLTAAQLKMLEAIQKRAV